MQTEIQRLDRSMKKIVEEEKMKKKDDAPLGDKPQLRHGDSSEPSIEEMFREAQARNKDLDDAKRGITSGDDLLDQAFNIALKKKFDKK